MKQHKLFWGSSYDRGLQYLLFMWPDILEKYPDAELHICYGWEMFDTAFRTNPERMKWKASLTSMMNQKGVYHHGRVGKQKLEKIRKECGIWAYPTEFTEINCITALEAQRDGLVPVSMTLAALNETVGSGIKIDGDIRRLETQEKFSQELLKMMGDEKLWQAESKKAKAFAKSFSWEKSAKEWLEEFVKTNEPLVSVITVTKREGFWNLMLDNLSKQTYKNFEWIIVDDYKEDRSEIAKTYAEKFNLNIRYIRGDKALGEYERPYGLVRANNKAWKASEGELLVFIQDFITIPETGIEDLVSLYTHNPKALLAPTDNFFNFIKPNFSNKEDWFDGRTDVVTTPSWVNVRNTYDGIRRTENPFDFEMDYCAIPKSIVDHLNGWWEFFDESIGYDNTEFAYRALKAGYEIIIDDTNTATCLDLDPYIPHTKGDGNKKRYQQIQKKDPVRKE